MEDKIQSILDEEPPEQQDSKPPVGPALIITIQSWSSPVIGLAILAIGLLTGYYARPLIIPPETSPPPTVVRANPTTVSAPPAADPAQSSSTDLENRQQALMAALIPQTVHFKGNPDAPVTLIEFSDFQ